MPVLGTLVCAIVGVMTGERMPGVGSTEMAREAGSREGVDVGGATVNMGGTMER